MSQTVHSVRRLPLAPPALSGRLIAPASPRLPHRLVCPSDQTRKKLRGQVPMGVKVPSFSLLRPPKKRGARQSLLIPAVSIPTSLFGVAALMFPLGAATLRL